MTTADTYPRRYSAKYEETKGLSNKELAKLVRKDIKAAIKAGDLPKIKTSVRSRSGAIDCEIKEVPFDVFRYPTEDEVKWENRNPKWRNVMTDEAKRVRNFVEALRNAYNFNGSDAQRDYFDLRYYGGTQYSTGLK